MPHLIANRPRLYDLFKEHPAARDQFRWETINAITYKIGGVIFLVGSALFFPAFDHEANLGAWLFVIGSFLYLAVNVHDAFEVALHRDVLRRQRERTGLNFRIEKLKLELIVTGAYLVGSVLFIVGSVFFLSEIGWVYGGAWCFIVGSVLFAVGASVNILQILQAETFVTLQLMNLTAVTFVIGSLLFAVASIPYLWRFESAADQRLVLELIAAQFVLGSALFVAGGILNYIRAYMVIRRRLGRSTPR